MSRAATGPAGALNLAIEAPAAAFAEAVAADLGAPGLPPVAAAENWLETTLLSSLSRALGDVPVKPPVVRLRRGREHRSQCLPWLEASGLNVWYTELRYSTPLGVAFPLADLRTTGLDLLPISYGGGLRRTHQMRTRALKRQVNHQLELLSLRIPGGHWAALAERLRGEPPPQPLVAHPCPAAPGPQSWAAHDIEGFRLVSFDHMVTGERVFCGCARPAHRAMAARLELMLPRFVGDGWAPAVHRQIVGARYADGICHLCVARADGPAAAGRAYGRAVEEFDRAYRDQLAAERGLDGRTARAEVQRILGISRWKREAELHKVILELFPDTTVMREASPDWLGRQRLDIWLPDLQLAIEYQGEQHSAAVGRFGGEEGLARARERDGRKRALCAANGITLVEVLHTQPISAAAIGSRLRRHIRPPGSS